MIVEISKIVEILITIREQIHSSLRIRFFSKDPYTKEGNPRGTIVFLKDLEIRRDYKSLRDNELQGFRWRE